MSRTSSKSSERWKCGAASVKTEPCPHCGQALGKYGALMDLVDAGKEFLVMMKNVLVSEDRIQKRQRPKVRVPIPVPSPEPSPLPKPVPASATNPTMVYVKAGSLASPLVGGVQTMTEAMRAQARQLRRAELEGDGD